MDKLLCNLKLAWRTSLRDKLYSGVKISSLAIGIAACILIAMFIRHELSYDKHYKNTHNIYRVYRTFHSEERQSKSALMTAPLAKTLLEEYPEIEKAGRINAMKLFGAGNNQIRRSDKLDNTFEKGVVFADQGIIETLDMQFVYGNPQNALSNANTIVITKSRADKLFPNENPVGKTLFVNNNIKKPYEITGVINDFPQNSHINYHFFLALHPNGFYKGEQNRWDATSYYTYVRVRQGTDIPFLEEKLNDIVTKYIDPFRIKEGYESIAQKKSYKLQPVKDIHLNPDQVSGGPSHGDIRFVWLFAAIATCILILACINFINLSLAKSGNRAKEVGFRKTIGAKRNSIALQFISESVIYSFISILIGVLLVGLFLTYFNNLSSKSLTIPWKEWWFFPIILSISVVIGALAGFYPSLFLSKIKPIIALKGKFNQSKKMSGVFSSLVVFQFAVSITLVIGSALVFQQMSYIINKKVGFEKELVIVLNGTKSFGDKIGVFKNELMTLPNVQSVSISNYLPFEGTMRNGNPFNIEGKGEDPIVAERWEVDPDYIKTLGMNIIEGRDFSKEISSDIRTVVINKVMAKKLQLENPIGERLINWGGAYEIIGVVEDFHFASMKKDIEPLCLVLGKSTESMVIKIGNTEIQSTLRSIEKRWAEFSPNQSIRYSFLDYEFAMMYEGTKRMGSILMNFTILAIFIACMGLFALAQFTIKERIKEIGIRKVNGAKVSEILTMLNRDFIKWVAIAFVVACPIAWYAMNKWLENFAYKTTLSWWIFALAGVLALGIALLTVSWQSWRAATRNPVEALRYE